MEIINSELNTNFMEQQSERLKKEIEATLGLPHNFLDDMPRNDDWSFIIKLHSLIEGAISHLLETHFKCPDTIDIFRQLELSNKKTGKLAFVKAYGLLSDDHRRFISSLSEIRNNIVHNVKNVQFSLNSLLNETSSFNKYYKAFAFYKESRTEAQNKSEFIANPKIEIWLNGFLIIMHCYLKANRLILQEDFKQVAKNMGLKYEQYEEALRTLFTHDSPNANNLSNS